MQPQRAREADVPALAQQRPQLVHGERRLELSLLGVGDSRSRREMSAAAPPCACWALHCAAGDARSAARSIPWPPRMHRHCSFPRAPRASRPTARSATAPPGAGLPSLAPPLLVLSRALRGERRGAPAAGDDGAVRHVRRHHRRGEAFRLQDARVRAASTMRRSPRRSTSSCSTSITRRRASKPTERRGHRGRARAGARWRGGARAPQERRARRTPEAHDAASAPSSLRRLAAR